MINEWVEKVDEQINFLLNESPSLSNARDLSALYILQDKLSHLNHISPEQRIHSLSAQLQCDLTQLSDTKRKVGRREPQAIVEQAECVLESLNNTIQFIYQGISVEQELELLKSLISFWNDKLS